MPCSTDPTTSRRRSADSKSSRPAASDDPSRPTRATRSRSTHWSAPGAPPGSLVTTTLPVPLVGDDLEVPCIDGTARRYLNLDARGVDGRASRGGRPGARLPALVLERAPRGGLQVANRDRRLRARSRRDPALRRPAVAIDDVAIICRNTTEAINHLAYRLRLTADDVVVTTVVEHHANLLPWARVARAPLRRVRDRTARSPSTTSSPRSTRRPGRSCSRSPARRTSRAGCRRSATIIAAAHDRGVPVLRRRRAARAAPAAPAGRRLRRVERPQDVRAVRRRRARRAAFDRSLDGDPFLAGGGAVDLVDLDEVVWTDPPEREEAGSPNVIGAVALHAAIDELAGIGWDADHGARRRARRPPPYRPGGDRRRPVLGPALDEPTLPVATFVVDGVHHALVAARLSAEHGIGVRHGCFCAHPYLLRLLDLTDDEVARLPRRRAARRSPTDARRGARASATIATTAADVDRLLAAVARVADGTAPPVAYEQDEHTGDYWPDRRHAGMDGHRPHARRVLRARLSRCLVQQRAHPNPARRTRRSSGPW